MHDKRNATSPRLPNRSRLCLCLALTLLASCDEGTEDKASATPDSYSALLIYVADGVWNPADAAAAEATLERAQREVWGLSDEQIAAYELETKGFFVERFGLDLDDPANAERLQLIPFGCDPRIAYRVVTMAGRSVPAEGWPLCDAGYLLTVIAPEGVELGGDFEGRLAPSGSTFAYGRYYIDAGAEQDMRIDFRSITPYLADPFGVSAIRCEVDSAELGSGEANIVYKLDQLPDSQFQVMVRNVLTFD